MKFEFSTTVEKANCHIRTYDNGIIQPEIIDQRPHKHFFLEFHCVFAGEEIITLPEEHREIHLLPGQILMLPREIYHGAYTKKGTVERLCFNFSVEPSEKGAHSVMEQFLTIRDVRLFEDGVANSLANQCRLLRAQTGTQLADVRLGMLMLNMVLHLCSNLTGPRQPAAPESSHALRQKWFIEEYIESHFTDDCSLEGLAQALFLSQRQTRTLIHRFFNEDYKSIIIRRRMELAAFYLQDEEKTLEEVAALVGYSSYSGFQLCFKRYFGMTPSEKRK